MSHDADSPTDLASPQDEDNHLQEILVRMRPFRTSAISSERSSPVAPVSHADDLVCLPPKVPSLPHASAAALASPLEDDDLLREILLRLTSQPSSLPRASAVCKRWRGILTDPKFLRRFYAHHRKPSLLGFFEILNGRNHFMSILDPPNRIPPERFNLKRHSNFPQNDVLDCRHGRVLVKCRLREEFVVCDPITGEQNYVSMPPKFKCTFVCGAVLCIASDQGHVHGGCYSSPIKVVLVYTTMDYQALACVYSSETGMWSNIISTSTPCQLLGGRFSGTLIGKALYWPLFMPCKGILEFNLEKQILTVIKGPPLTNDFNKSSTCIIQTEDGVVGLAVLSYPHFQLWQRDLDCHVVDTWVLQKTIEIHNILGLPPKIGGRTAREIIVGYSEDTDEVFILVGESLFIVQLKSMQFKILKETRHMFFHCPLTSFYAPGTTIKSTRENAS